MYRLSVYQLTNKMRVEFSQLFPEEVLLQEELYGVIRGLINSLRWAALEEAQDSCEEGKLTKSIDTIRTTEHFNSSRMGRPEIIDRIANTSGLNDEMSSHALTTIENEIDNAFAFDSVVEVELIGRIQSTLTHEYFIELDKNLQIEPHGSSEGTPLVAGA